MRIVYLQYLLKKLTCITLNSIDVVSFKGFAILNNIAALNIIIKLNEVVYGSVLTI